MRARKVRPSRRKKGKIFVISAPSGCGKTTLCKKLLDEQPGLANSISMTTRPPRPGERDGIDYRFVPKEYFQKMMREDGFLECEDNFGHLYGTPRKFVEDNIRKGISVLLSIDVKGAVKVKKAYPLQSVLIFLIPPSMQALKERLKKRRSEGREAISKRLAIAKNEMGYKNEYDYKIVNNRLGDAYKRLKKTVMCELSD